MRPEGSLTYRVPERLRQGSCGVGRAAQALVCASAKEGTAFRMEAVQEGAAGVESEQAALGEEAVLLLDDIMAEVEVVAEEEGLVERREEAQRAQQAVPGPGPMTPESALEELLAVQVELEPVNAQARKAFSRQREKMERRRKPHLDRRGAVIQSVPGFWANVIANHPQMSALITDEDEDMLSYMVSLEVEEEKHRVHLCKIMLFFRSNPYFQNKVITKEYLVNITGLLIPLQLSGIRIMKWRPIAADTTTAALTSSTGSLTTTSQDLTRLLRSYVRTCGAIPCNTTRG
ncbi:testis-specific Y-encoded protein 2 isoform X6 [Homo sapiens]|uniref:testis-specific Y-encoded protein 2 isoform X2 n=1 Tax=Homo sapiens TaxID=9606 RepID=UPI0007DC61C4|nr:testis-specific Y-encoded protein 2 isoform X2 [Homo sapiens]XP_054184296.1 testis-specific Y-encoded protein 2 isoform X6 [Homo sapiens]|eukprot:XP_016885551.1 testis-specific Y-encoded protein 2 isoform X2 [Homo sapiens]